MPLDADQIEVVREISMETDLSYVTNLCGNLTSEQEIRLGSILGDWDDIRFVVGDLIPSRENELFVAQEERRRQIRHTVRMMLGLPPVSDNEIAIAELNGTFGSLSGGFGGQAGTAGASPAESGIISAGGVGGAAELGN